MLAKHRGEQSGRRWGWAPQGRGASGRPRAVFQDPAAGWSAAWIVPELGGPAPGCGGWNSTATSATPCPAPAWGAWETEALRQCSRIQLLVRPSLCPPCCGWSPREKGASWVATRVKRGRPCPPAHVGRACPAQQLGGTAASRRLGRPQTPGWTAPRHSVQRLLATSALAYARGPSPALGPPLLCTSTLTCTVQTPQVPTQTC